LLHLTFLERRSPKSAEQVERDEHFRYYNSLKWLYQLAIVVGLSMAVYIYLIAFDDFSETEMVNLSPLWFLLFNFGISGLYTEKAVRFILDHKANTFAEGLSMSTQSLIPLFRIVVYIVFLPPFLLLSLKKLSSPLLISLLTTLFWGVGLYVFLMGIFPSL